MDEQVLAAITRWPNVPAVYGWLSLTEKGSWRLHPDGSADSGTSGDPITSPQIMAFIGRNYASDDHGQWFFQNGPQRVYVHLEAAPWIIHTSRDRHRVPTLITHTGAAFAPVLDWWLDEQGRLFPRAGMGAGMIAGGDMPDLVAHLQAQPDRPGTPAVAWDRLDNALEEDAERPLRIRLAGTDHPGVPLRHTTAEEIPAQLGFIRWPAPRK